MSRLVACPRCGLLTDYNEANDYRPFCSLRCKESDLYGWLADPADESDETHAEAPDAHDGSLKLH